MDDDAMVDLSLGSLPTLIVPDDPVNGAIEKPKTPPPVEIDASRLPVAVAQQKAAAKDAEATATDSPLQPAATPRSPGNSVGTSAVDTASPPANTSARVDGLPPTTDAIPRAALSPRSPRAKSKDGDGIEIAMFASEDERPAQAHGGASPVADASLAAVSEPAAPVSPPTAAPIADAGARPTTAAATAAPQLSSKDYGAMAKRAKALAKLDRLAAGNKSVFDATMQDIGALGIGLQLYFMLTKYLSVVFLAMGVVALPTIVVNYYGNGVTDKLVDPLQLAYASLGNQGVNEETASDPSQCLPKGGIDCSWATVDTPFTSDPATVSWIITTSDCVYSAAFLVFYLVFRFKARQAIERHMTENLTPGKFAVYVRGLPPDATDDEILAHFNARYDPTVDDEYFPLWLSCCWGRRRKLNKALQAATTAAVGQNQSVVTNLDHLAGTTLSSTRKEMYVNTWIAEVSVSHPTGGLLRTFLSMEALTKGIAETQELVDILELEKQRSDPSARRTAFRFADEKLLVRAKAKLALLSASLANKTSKIKALKTPDAGAKSAAHRVAPGEAASSAAEIAKAARRAVTTTERAFNWEACECAFVVFNNLESRRRCLRDYRKSTWFFPRRHQPKLLRFRGGRFPLVVVPAPEPSNILWENLEVTDRGRLYRRSFTNLVTLLLLLFSCVIISGAQSAQAAFKAKMPPAGLCEWSLPQVFYGNASFDANPRVSWTLAWDANATCTPGAAGEKRFHIAYTNGIEYDFVFSRSVALKASEAQPRRCVDPCISESSSATCNTLPCFDQDQLDAGDVCETYLESHILYCFCTDALSGSLAEFGVFDGPRQLWAGYEPCRGFIADYLTKNAFIVVAAAIVVLVNLLLKAILRAFATFERHSSESAKASAIAVKMFSAQFLNTAIIVLVVNAAMNVSRVPLARDLFKGKYKDFERDWYPTVGMGITMTMLINAFVPQGILFAHMFVVSPLARCAKRRSVRTQDLMNKLFAGPAFDISVRYPMILNSVFVTMIFCGGSPVLLFIASLAAAGTYWLDKLSILHLYSVKTAYDEELGEIALALLPWTLVLHLAFSAWMYGNTKLMKSTTIDLTGVLAVFGYEPTSNATDSNALYAEFLAKASKVDVLGENGFMVKVVHSTVMTMFVFFLVVLAGILVSTLWLQVLLPIFKRTLFLVLRAVWKVLKPQLLRLVSSVCGKRTNRATKHKKSAKVAVDNTPPAPATTPSDAVLDNAVSVMPTDLLQATTPSTTDNPVLVPAGGGAVQLLVPKSAPPPAASTSASTPQAQSLSPRSRPRIMPEFTDFFRKSVARRYRPDAKLGFEKNERGELVRKWKEETVLHGTKRLSGDPMRTWEAMQAPVKIYAIEANDKYRLAVTEMVAAAKRGGLIRPPKVGGQSTAVLDEQKVAASIEATEPMTSAAAPVGDSGVPSAAVASAPVEAAAPTPIVQVDSS
ncbi:hypothetical protein PybrP1_010488 [[Pythium] brassicae (nom. inval.)]|nr:hypothetical protein PybrP1_010488 [[Pythium] brassicae (nom. inval.)]